MKPLNIRPYKSPGKEDCHPPEGYKNWWEDVGNIGDGKLIQELDNEISIGIEEYEMQQQEDLEDYNKLIMEGILGH